MNKVFDTYRPDGFGTISPYIMSENPEELIDFLKNAFYAEELNRSINPSNGDIANCILKMGASSFMISQARDQFLNMRTTYYLYVEEVDSMYKRALQHGAKSEFAPTDMPYDDRQAGVIDPSGNYWWISKRLKKENY
ncbi:MAG TPA: hypothetical protein PKL31_07965 [Fulvivirga sp.]|nr:hypothetical protein [Fulvivirga sp.]